MKNFVTETDLKGFIPELTKNLWNGETDFSKQKEKAEQTVIEDLINKGYDLTQLQVPLEVLEEETEDGFNRIRYYLTYSGTGTLILQGTNDEDYKTVKTITLSSGTSTTGIITDVFLYYKISVTGITDYHFYLYESQYDLLYAYKWLELIMLDSFREEGDRYHTLALEFRNMYNFKLNNMIVNLDTDGDGESDSQISSNLIEVTR